MKKIIIVTAFFLTGGYLSAQDATDAQDAIHEYSIFGGGGLSALRYSPTVGSQRGSFGGEFGLGYTYSRKQWGPWGIHAGAGVSLYGAKATINNQPERFITEHLIDNEGDIFEMRTLLSNYEEKHTALILHIPVMGRYAHNQFFGMLGFKFGIPLSGKFSTSGSSTLSNHAYYPDYHNTLTSQTFAGFGDFQDYTSKGSHDFGMSIALALEGGMKWNIGDNLLLYAGLYFDIGLNDVARGGNFHYVDYEAGVPASFSTNSILSALDEKAGVIAAGVKLRLALRR